MIRITCTSCKNVLSIDDAFAGGVCRCQHCGTIQTVPAHLKGSAEKAAAVQTTEAAASARSPKLLYKNEARGAVGSGSGLDDLANLVASSGLSDPNLSKTRPTAARTSAKKTAGKKNQTMILLGAASAVIVLLIVVVVLLLFRGKSSTTPAGSSDNNPTADGGSGGSSDGGTPAQPTPHTIAGPGFGTIKLSETTIIYLIDNGSSASELLDYVKAAVYHSIESLGSDRKFQILFWNPESPSFPTGTDTSFATPDNLDAAKKHLEDTIAMGKTDVGPSLKTALASSPGEIVLITAKGDDLDDSMATDVMTARGSSAVKIHTVAINGAPADGVLAKIAKQTGGTFLTLPEADLKAMAY